MIAVDAGVGGKRYVEAVEVTADDADCVEHPGELLIVDVEREETVVACCALEWSAALATGREPQRDTRPL